MSLLLAAILQAISASPPERVDCAAQRSETDEVVVCANRDGESPYRLTEVPEPNGNAALPKAEVKVADGVGVGAEMEKAEVGGFDLNRAMVRLKFKF